MMMSQMNGMSSDPNVLLNTLRFSSVGTRGFSVPGALVSLLGKSLIAKLKPAVEENMKMTDCYYEKKDWRQCKTEVRSSSQFSDCFAYHV